MAPPPPLVPNLPAAAAAAAAAPPPNLLDQWWSWWGSGIFTAILILILSVNVESGMFPWFADRLLEFWHGTPHDVCIDAILASTVGDLPASYVSRPSLTELIAAYISTAGLHYLVVVGPRGCGKSVGVVAAAHNHTGVIRVTFSESKGSVNAQILKEVCPDFPVQHDAPLNEHFLAGIFRGASAKYGQQHPDAAPWVPTVIAEVDSVTTDSSVATVAKAMKRLGSDTESCRSIVVLSDALAAFALPGDDHRIKLLWVEDFSQKEADIYLNVTGMLPLGVNMSANGTDLNRAWRESVFDRVGTRPVLLKSLVTDVRDPATQLEPFLEDVLNDALKILRRLIMDDPGKKNPTGSDMKRLVKLMLNSSTNTVEAGTLDGVLGQPNEVVPLLKKYRAIMYHYPSDSYRFYTPAYLHAARRLVSNS
jgi:hypothetical protein